MPKYVSALSLNIRSDPIVDPSNKLGTIFLGQRVEVLDEETPPGWLRISAELEPDLEDVRELTGFVSKQFLRDPVSDQREHLIAAARHEWMRFRRGAGKEHVDPFFRFVGQMWHAIDVNLDGRDRDVPWSAAAISFIVRNAGSPYEGFKFAAAHARYIHDSIVKRENSDRNVPFWGFRLHERRPQLGDIVCRWREVEVDFDDARNRDDFKSHCDIIVKIDSENDQVIALEGNVSQSVSTTTYTLHLGIFWMIVTVYLRSSLTSLIDENFDEAGNAGSCLTCNNASVDCVFI